MATFDDTRRIAGKPTRRQLAALDRQIEAIYYRSCSGVQIPMLAISGIFAAGRAAAAAGGDVEAAILAAVAAVRTN
jgi:hypothetical protein